MPKRQIYLDYNATTPLHPEVKKAMVKAMDVFGNPSSLHVFGRQIKGLVEEAREKVALFIGALPEEIIFTGGNIAHIINEIIVYPKKPDASIDKRYEQMKLTPEQREYFKTVHSWLEQNWLPICSLKADGQFGYNELEIDTDNNQTFTITDHAWYEPATGRFTRVMKTGEQVLFANSYDGKYVYSSETIDDGLTATLLNQYESIPIISDGSNWYIL